LPSASVCLRLTTLQRFLPCGTDPRIARADPTKPTDPPASTLGAKDHAALPSEKRYGRNMTAETRRIWLGFLNHYRTMCLAPQPDFRRLLELIQGIQLAAQASSPAMESSLNGAMVSSVM